MAGRIKISWIVGLVVMTAVPLVVFHFVTKKEPKIVYAVSDSLETTSSETPIYVGQIRIENLGNLAAVGVRCKIRASVKNIKVRPHFQSDEHSVDVGQEHAEVLYETLVPGGRFTIVFETFGRDTDPVAVSLENGRATNAFSSRSSPWIAAVAYGVLIVIFILSSMAASRHIAHSFALNRAANWPLNLIQSKKSFLLSSSTWDSIVRRAIDIAFAKPEPWMQAIVDTPAYKFLDSPKPRDLSGELFIAAVDRAGDALSVQFAMCLVDAPGPSHLIDSLRAPRPLNLPESRWSRIRASVEAASLGYIQAKVGDMLQYHPDMLLQFHALLSLLNKTSFSDIVEKHIRVFVMRSNGMEDLDTAYSQLKLTEAILGEFRAVRILDMMEALYSVKTIMAVSGASSKLPHVAPAWFRPKNHDQLLAALKKLVTVDSSIASHAALKSIMNEIFEFGTAPKERPSDMLEEDWRSVKDMLAKVTSHKRDAEQLAQENERLNQELSAGRAALATDREQVTRQLEVIYNLLIDPASFSRLETYAIPFAPGNVDVLRRLATELCGQSDGGTRGG